ncbi:MAG: hypothetical protein PVI20_16845 [Desulfobacteraceae bacterium]|jgi:hypothetical protein
MYALIYDEHDPDVREKPIISMYNTREEAEKALDQRQQRLRKRVWECYTRIVWLKKSGFHEGDQITPIDFETWAPDDKIPEGEYNTDTE